jgi:hypothetical protein
MGAPSSRSTSARASTVEKGSILSCRQGSGGGEGEEGGNTSRE